MRPTAKRLWVLGALVLGWSLAGCGGGTQGPPAPPAGTDTGTGGAPATTAALGSEQAAGPFQVTLFTKPSAPKAGETKFQAKVLKGGQPVTDATVTVSLSMPSMKMSGPEITLKPTGEQYEGSGNLAMGGEYEAKTTVAAGADSGTTVYRFSAGQ